MGGNEGINISAIQNKNLAKLAEKFDVGGVKGVLEKSEFINFKNAMSEAELVQIAGQLVDENASKLDSKEFTQAFGISAEEVKKYINANSTNKKVLRLIVDSFSKATPEEIAQNIEAIASDKYGAADDVAFKLWISKIDKTNAFSVFSAYKKQFNGATPFNAIIEERKSGTDIRKKEILYVLSAIEGALGKNRSNSGLISDFKTQLTCEMNSWMPASANELNRIYDKLLAGLPTQNETLKQRNITLQNVRPNLSKISLGAKYGKFSWQYSAIKDIKSIEDVAKLTGLSVDYLNELIGSEGVKEAMYTCSSDQKTIGIGHNFENASQEDKNYLSSTRLTESERYQILAFDLVEAIQRLQNKELDTTKLTQGQYEALVDVSFNAPACMNDLIGKTIQATNLKSTNPQKAAELFDEAAYEFNQQYSNQKIAPGLCKRRIQNVMRFMGVKSLKELPENSRARTRIGLLALNGYRHSSGMRTISYRKDLCKIMGINASEFFKLKYPEGYPIP